MQCKESQHNETLRDLLKTLTLLRKCLMNTLENSSRYMLESKIVLEGKKRQSLPRISFLKLTLTNYIQASKDLILAAKGSARELE